MGVALRVYGVARRGAGRSCSSKCVAGRSFAEMVMQKQSLIDMGAVL